MAVLKDKKRVGPQFSKDAEIIRVAYDFSKDTGGIADYDVLEADGPCIVRFEFAHVTTAVTSSGGGFVCDLGKGAGGTDFWSDKQDGSLTLEALVLSDTVGACVELEDGEKIVLGIETEAATAGLFDMVFTVFKKR